MIDPTIISATPFENTTAFVDLAGMLAIMHQQIAETVSALTQVAVRLYPLGNGRGEKPWLQSLTQQMQAECSALAIQQPPDFSDFDLHDEAEFYSWTFLLGNETDRIRQAAGII